MLADVQQKLPDYTSGLGKLHFILHELGMPVTPKQEEWLGMDKKLVNIVMTGNQFGKTTNLGLDHLVETITKSILTEKGVAPDVWQKTKFDTLIFAPTYEVVRGVFSTCVDILNGEYVIRNPDNPNDFRFNVPKLEGVTWKAKQRPHPEITFPQLHATVYFRSADDLGASFKMRKLAMVSGDEAGDVANLIPLLETVLKPRVAFWGGRINLYGTPQESMDLFSIADRKERGKDEDITIFRGSMYDNTFIPKENIKRLDESLDPVSRKRVIYGEQVTFGDRYFPPSAVMRTFLWDKQPDAEGWIEQVLPNRRYIIAADFAASKDRTVFAAFRYDQWLLEEPEAVYPVYWRHFVGRQVPIAQQYEDLIQLYLRFKEQCPFTNLIIDASSFGGKNAEQALSSCYPYPWHRIRGQIRPKMEALGATRQLMEAGRKLLAEDGGDQYKDGEEEWGLLRLPSEHQIKREFLFYRLDDKFLETDNVMATAMACWWLKFICPYRNKITISDYDPLLM